MLGVAKSMGDVVGDEEIVEGVAAERLSGVIAVRAREMLKSGFIRLEAATCAVADTETPASAAFPPRDEATAACAAEELCCWPAWIRVVDVGAAQGAAECDPTAHLLASSGTDELLVTTSVMAMRGRLAIQSQMCEEAEI